MPAIVTNSGPNFESASNIDKFSDAYVSAIVPVVDVPDWTDRFADEIDAVIDSHLSHYFVENMQYKFVGDFCHIVRNNGVLDPDVAYDYFHAKATHDDHETFDEDVADEMGTIYRDDIIPALRDLKTRVEIPWANITYICHLD